MSELLRLSEYRRCRTCGAVSRGEKKTEVYVCGIECLMAYVSAENFNRTYTRPPQS